MADITKFFKALSERAYKENDLSDVTYAMCEADVKFRQFFLDIFFKDSHLDACKVTIEREHYDKNGRPDFWIENEDGTPYIVEVKIWDGHQHFDDYFKILSHEAEPTGNLNNQAECEAWRRLGYIANYESVKDVKIGATDKKSSEVCRVATWKEFLERLSLCEHFDDPAIEAYAGYLKNVCPFDEFELNDAWKISTGDFTAIKTFDDNLKAVINQNHANGVKLYTGSPRRFRSQQWMGQFFEWTIGGGKIKLSSKKVWGWLGARYTDKGAVVCVEFEDMTGWGKPVCDSYRSDVKGGVLRFYAKDSEDAAKCKEELDSFFGSVLRSVREGEVLGVGNGIYCMDVNSVGKYSEQLLSMKCLPFALENHFFDDEFVATMAQSGYEFAFVYGNDQEIPGSHCGRYFELRKKVETDGNGEAQKPSGDTGSHTIYRGWIGVDYNDSCQKDINQPGRERKTYLDSPAFTIEISKDFPAAKSLQENSWGWKCVEFSNDNDWKSTLSEAKRKLLSLANNCGAIQQEKGMCHEM